MSHTNNQQNTDSDSNQHLQDNLEVASRPTQQEAVAAIRETLRSLPAE